MEKSTHRIPDLKFNLFAINGDHSGTEFNTNSQVVDRLKTFVGKL